MFGFAILLKHGLERTGEHSVIVKTQIRLTKFSTENGLSFQCVLCFAEDKNEVVYAGTSNGSEFNKRPILFVKIYSTQTGISQ
jgi:hypothetical protein